MYTYQIPKETAPIPLLKPQSQTIAPTQIYGSLSSVVQRAQLEPSSLSREEWLHLESAIGSRAIEELKAGKKTPWVPEFRSISAEFMESSEMLKEARQGHNQVNSDYDASATVQRMGKEDQGYEGARAKVPTLAEGDRANSWPSRTPLKRGVLNLVGELDDMTPEKLNDERKYVQQYLPDGQNNYWLEHEFQIPFRGLTEVYAFPLIDRLTFLIKGIQEFGEAMKKEQLLKPDHKGDLNFRRYISVAGWGTLSTGELAHHVSNYIVLLQDYILKLEELKKLNPQPDNELTERQKEAILDIGASSLQQVKSSWCRVYASMKYWNDKEKKDPVRKAYKPGTIPPIKLNPSTDSLVIRLNRNEPIIPTLPRDDDPSKFAEATQKLWEDLTTQEVISRDLRSLLPSEQLSQLSLTELSSSVAKEIYKAAKKSEKIGVWKIGEEFLQEIIKLDMSMHKKNKTYNLVTAREFESHLREWKKGKPKTKASASK